MGKKITDVLTPRLPTSQEFRRASRASRLRKSFVGQAARAFWLLLVIAVISSCRAVPENALESRNDAELQELYTRLVMEARELYDANPRTPKTVLQAEEKYREAIKINNTEPDTLVAAARVNAWLAEFLADDAEQEKYAKAGLLLTNTALKIDSSNVDARFFRGVLAGFLAEANNSYGLDAVKKIEQDMTALIDEEAWTEHAGPLRVYGALLMRTPSPPTSIGSLRKAKKYLVRAIEVDPQWPENQLYMAELEFELADEKDKPEFRKSAKARLQEHLLDSHIQPPAGYSFEFKHWQNLAKALLDKNSD
ncbi:MAG: hypothetical protein L3J82_06755 [Planctomycetes bacterium]|nr:hypothetical protein [Planctomycetota bacterium]